MTTTQLNLRCSALPLAFRCPASIRRGAIIVNEAHEAADDGTAVHEVVRTLPTTDRIDWERIPAIAQKYGANAAEVRMLAAQAVKLWNQVKESFRGALTEVEVKREIAPGVWLTGHADILAISQNAMRVADWKSGRKDRDHSQQFRGYAALSLLASEDIEEVTGTGLWIRDGELENYTMSRRDAHVWEAELVEKVLNWDGTYRPGAHCLHCPRNHECEAANALVRRDVAALADTDLLSRVETELALMSDAEKVAVFQRADLVMRYAQRVRDAFRAYVEKNGDIVANGVRLTITEDTRRTLDPAIACPILEARGWNEQDFTRAIKLGISKVEAIVREKAGKGEGAAAVRELKKALADAGAITTETTKKLTEKRSA
jgi:hypothetical protein